MNDIISMKCITKNTECQGDKDMKKANRVIPNLEYENKAEKNEHGFRPGLKNLVLKNRL